jgi:hypothetical protein
MANARKTAGEDPRIATGLQEYASRVYSIPEVAGVVLVPGPQRDLFIYLDDRDWDVMDKVIDIEDTLFEMYDDLLFDVHFRYLMDRTFDESKANGEVVYRRA